MQTRKKEFIYGLCIVFPLASIVWLVNVSIGILTGPLAQVIGYKANTLTGLIISVVAIWGIGSITRIIITRSIFPKIEDFIYKIPIISIIYRSFRQIIDTLLKKKQQFLATVLVEYPLKGVWSLGFLTNENVQCAVNSQGTELVDDAVAVFIPSTPNPTNGMYVYVSKQDIQSTNMSIEDGIKCIMSAGVISPNLKGLK